MNLTHIILFEFLTGGSAGGGPVEPTRLYNYMMSRLLRRYRRRNK